MAGQEFETRLRQGVEAARSGDKSRARILLQQVLAEDPANEAALMWMASVSDSADDRRFYLQRALTLNPKNDRAREALRRMGIEVDDAPTAPARVDDRSDTNTPRRAQQDVRDYVPNLRADRTAARGLNGYFIAALVLVGVVAAILLASLAAQPAVSSANATETRAAENRQFAAFLPTASPTDDPRPPTETVFYGLIVTFDPSVSPLPPTFTETATPEPTDTPPPTATPLPLAVYPVVYTERGLGQINPNLLMGSADGSGIDVVAANVRDLALSGDGTRAAFVRVPQPDAGNAASSEPATADGDVTPEAAVSLEANTAPEGSVPPEVTSEPLSPAALPQLYTASLGDAASFESAAPLTALGGTGVISPVWSPDGAQIVFANDADGDMDLFTISPDGGTPTRLIENNARDTQPNYAPDGSNLVFSSDIDSPGLTEIYRYTSADESVVRLTDNAGSSYDAAYSPDGTRIAFASDRSGDGDIYVMETDGSGAVLITVDDANAEDRAPAWSPDGRFIAFASNRGDGRTFEWVLVDMTLGDLSYPVVPFSSLGGDAERLVFLPLAGR